jgi:hypothetical protein
MRQVPDGLGPTLGLLYVAVINQLQAKQKSQHYAGFFVSGKR